MKYAAFATTCLSLLLAMPGAATAQLAREPFIHDPSTIALSDGRYYTFGTRSGGLVSDDGWTWHSGGGGGGGGVAPDIVKIGDRHYVAKAGGWFGAPYYRIAIAGTARSLAVAGGDVVAVPDFTGAPEQSWRIDQLTDGTYRIMPRTMTGAKVPLALVAIGASTPALVRFDLMSDAGRWSFQQP
ncbi:MULTISPECIES: RICIN domain-containing protein [unclassified Sphingomonas]|uniref:RICIN domain-containing protein n=1 Tax=unclassified Sphingomonas TaxID=196159 RepID=UPI00226A802F|nr:MULTISPECIES: RICIN domain-containing protein [unclassified Sphingomonas]